MTKQATDNTLKSSASLDPARSVFVAANAGSGKTSLLTARVLALLLSGVEPGKILCLTFTNGAAAEMSARITQALGKWVMMPEAELEKELLKLVAGPISRDMTLRARGLFAQVLDAPVGLRLQTIHGFAQSLLARFPLEAGVGTHLSVIDETTQQALLKEARMQLFAHARDKGGEEGAALYALVQQLGEFNLLSMLNEMVKQKRKLSRFIEAAGGVEFAVKSIYRTFGMHPDTACARLMEEMLHSGADHCATLKAIAECLNGAGKASNVKTASALNAWLEAGCCEGALDGYADYMLVDHRPRKTLFTKGALSGAHEEYLTAEQERVEKLMARVRALRDAQFTASLISIGAKLIAHYDALKQLHGLMDFDDQILAATRLLSQAGMGSWVMFKLDGGIDHVLVDEAQDTSPEQWEIVRAITDEFYAGKGRREADRSLFVVGDEKQSIFRFQGADPAGLATNRSYFMQRLSDAAMPADVLALTHSYRSAPEILALVDTVFENELARQGLSAAGEAVAHQAKRVEAKGYAQLWPVTTPDEGGMGAEAKLARDVAAEVARLVAKGLNPGDVMILVRRRKSFMYQLARALKRRKIPVAGVDRMDLLDNLAVQDLLAFAQVLLLPEDDLTLAALLKSPLFNFSEEQLFALCHGRKESLWEQLSGEKGAYALLSEFRAKVDYVSPFALFAELLDARGYRRAIVGRMGEEYDEVLDVFLEQALLYERTDAPSMQGFLAWIQAGESELKRDMEHAGGLVRIMTAHGAKGLQAKLVIVADTTSIPTLQERMQWYAGVPLATVSADGSSDLLQQAKAREMELQMEEYRRLLYVALTRAEDMLIVCGAAFGKTKTGIQDGSWYQLVQRAFEQLGIVQEDGRIVIGAQHIESQKTKVITIAEGYRLLGMAPDEQLPPRPLSPSQLREQEPPAASPVVDSVPIQKGVAIHKMLQYLPAVKDAQQRAALARSLADTHAAGVPDDAKLQLLAQALSILEAPEFVPLFDARSLAEVPVSGMVEWKGNKVRVLGQIDRLAVVGDEVWIIDFKSAAKPPAASLIPATYIHQMALYKAVIQLIYPAHTVRAGLLWTAAARLDWISPELLDEVPAEAYI